MKSTIYHLYLGLASIIGLIVMIIFVGILGTSLLQRALISDTAYLAQNNYEIQNCMTQSFPDQKNPSTVRPPTKDEIDVCKLNVTDRLIASRDYQLKDSIINGIVYGLIGLIVFLLHFGAFRRSMKSEK